MKKTDLLKPDCCSYLVTPLWCLEFPLCSGSTNNSKCGTAVTFLL